MIVTRRGLCVAVRQRAVGKMDLRPQQAGYSHQKPSNRPAVARTLPVRDEMEEACIRSPPMLFLANMHI